MNTTQILHDHSGKTAQAQSELKNSVIRSPANEALQGQLKTDWLTHTITRDTIKDLHNDINNLINEAMDLSTTYHQHSNHQQIINKLTRAAELRKVIEVYYVQS